MPNILDPRIITLTDETRKIYAQMVEAEMAFCEAVGKIGHQRGENRQKLIFARKTIDVSAARDALCELEERRAEYLENVKADEMQSRDKRRFVGAFDTIGDQSTLPPRLVSRAGLSDITSDNLKEVVETLRDRAAFVKIQEVTAFRIGRLTLEEAVDEMEGQVRAQLMFIQNSREHGNNARAARQEAALEHKRDAVEKLQALARRVDADALHVRIRSGTGTRFRARFDGIGDAKWFTVPFTIANVAVVGVENTTIRNVAPRSREAHFKLVAEVGLFSVFEPRKPDDEND